MEGKKITYRNYSFPKEEKLSSKKLIDALFAKGASFYFYPFSIRFMPITTSFAVHQFMASVSKRNFKKAVDRNRVKRLMREAYRLNKHIIANHLKEDKYLAIAYIYSAKEILSFDVVESKLVSSFKRLKDETNKSTDTKK